MADMLQSAIILLSCAGVGFAFLESQPDSRLGLAQTCLMTFIAGYHIGMCRL